MLFFGQTHGIILPSTERHLKISIKLSGEERYVSTDLQVQSISKVKFQQNVNFEDVRYNAIGSKVQFSMHQWHIHKLTLQ